MITVDGFDVGCVVVITVDGFDVGCVVVITVVGWPDWVGTMVVGAVGIVTVTDGSAVVTTEVGWVVGTVIGSLEEPESCSM